MTKPTPTTDRAASRRPRQTAASRATDFEMRVKPAVQKVAEEMTRTGLGLDIPALLKERDELTSAIAALEETVETLAGKAVPLDAESLRELLHAELRLPVVRRNRDGDPRVDAASLCILGAHHPLPVYIATLKEKTSLLSPLKELLDWLDPESGRLHIPFNPDGTVTGRTWQDCG